MISKEKFVDIINKLKEIDDFIEETNKRAKKLRNSMIADFFEASSIFSSNEIILDLLESIFDDNGDILGWWIYDLNYGRKYEDGCITDKNGDIIDLSTTEKLYDYLVEEMSNNINKQEEFIRKECSKCENTNEEDCNIVQKIDGEYDCVNKKIDKEEK